MTAHDTTIQVGSLTFPLGDRPTRCGIHGAAIVDRRCPACDAECGARYPRPDDDGTGEP